MSQTERSPSEEYRFTPTWPYHISCGGIVFRGTDEQIEILLLVHHNGHFDIPKGTLRRTETLEQGALREVQEESGQRGEVIGYLGGRLDESTSDGRTISKITHYFAIAWTANTGVHDDEYRHFIWASPQKVLRLLKPSSVEIVQRFQQFVSRGG